MYIYTIHLCMYSRGEKEGGWSGGVGGLTREDIWAQPRCSSLHRDPPRVGQFRRILPREKLYLSIYLYLYMYIYTYIYSYV